MGSNQTLQRPTETVRVTEGCEVLDPCTGGKCPAHSLCVAKWETYSCKCHKGELFFIFIFYETFDHSYS